MAERPVSAEELLSFSREARIEQLRRLSETELVRLAFELRGACYRVWTTDPIAFAEIENVFEEIAGLSTHFVVRAVYRWVSGLKSLVLGDLGSAIRSFTEARDILLANKEDLEAAEVAVAMVYPLALAGEEDAAIEIGQSALKVFLDNDKLLSAAKIEHNLGNIFHRRDRYSEAEAYFRSALTRFDRIDDATKFAQISNSLANAIAHQAKLAEAETIYQDALEYAKVSNQSVLIAEIESNLGRLNVVRGRIDRAVFYFESSLRCYESLGLPLQTAVSELEIAESFVELNLFKEGIGILERLVPIFRAKRMNQELCSSLSHYAFSLLQAGNRDAAAKALTELVEAAEAGGSSVLKGYAHLLRFRLLLDTGDLEPAAIALSRAREFLIAGGSAVRAAQAELATGTLQMALGHHDRALDPLQKALSIADEHRLSRVELDTQAAIGRAYLLLGELKQSEMHLKRAVELTETLRAPIAGEEFRLGFLSDKVRAYQDLIDLNLKKATDGSRQEAFLISERARSRTLFEAINDPNSGPLIENEVLQRKREELTLLNFRNSRAEDGDRGAEERRSARIATLEREIDEQHLRASATTFRKRQEWALDAGSFVEVCERLDEHTLLIEYAAAGDRLVAFVVGKEGVRGVVEFGPIEKLSEDVYRFRLLAAPTFLDEIHINFSQVRSCLEGLYRSYFAPIEPYIGDCNRVVVIPFQDLFHIPFHSLHDGNGFMIEELEFVYAPSAMIYLGLCRRQEVASGSTANVAIGVDAVDLSWVRQEIEEFCEIFTEAIRLEGSDATKAGLARSVAGADIVHIACHGVFRADNPLYSSLRLHDGPLMVRDCRALDLSKCRLAVLSACETGISKITDGEEALGLVRGFLSAGAANLVLSHWVVEDSATRRIMKRFYELLNEGRSPSSALRGSQLELIEDMPHPFFWAPFYAIGA